MTTMTRRPGPSTALAILVVLAAWLPGVGAAPVVRMHCDAFDAADAAISARYVRREDRITFQFSYKLPRPGERSPGDAIALLVGDREVGRIVLVELAGGGLGAGAGYDSLLTRSLSHAPAAMQPFPARWPERLEPGTRVAAGGLSCELERP